MLFLKVNLSIGFLWLTVTIASAQFTTGNQFIGGGFGLSTPVAPKFAPKVDVLLQPEFGRFRSPDIAVGLTATLGISHTTKPDEKINSFSVGIEPFIQRFLFIIPRFGLVLTARSGITLSTSNDKSFNNMGVTTKEETKNGISLALSGSPGLFYQLNQRWLLLLDIGSYQALAITYSGDRSTLYPNNDATTYSQLNYGIGRTFSLSGSAIQIRYFLR